MGAGALEAPTTKLQQYPVLDVRELNAADRKKLVMLAKAVWEKENPIDWGTLDAEPSEALQELDEWTLHKTGRKTLLKTLYEDIRAVCEARLVVAKDKAKKVKKSKTENIGNVAESIARAILPKIQTRNFPDDFINTQEHDLSFNFDRRSIKQVSLIHLLDSYDVEVTTITGATAYEGSHPRAVAEAITRALLWGRSTFSVSSDRKVMDQAVNQFIKWVSTIEKDIETAITESALGTGYEEILKREIYNRLGIHPLSGAKILPSQIAL